MGNQKPDNQNNTSIIHYVQRCTINIMLKEESILILNNVFYHTD